MSVREYKSLFHQPGFQVLLGRLLAMEANGVEQRRGGGVQGEGGPVITLGLLDPLPRQHLHRARALCRGSLGRKRPRSPDAPPVVRESERPDRGGRGTGSRHGSRRPDPRDGDRCPSSPRDPRRCPASAHRMHTSRKEGPAVARRVPRFDQQRGRFLHGKRASERGSSPIPVIGCNGRVNQPGLAEVAPGWRLPGALPRPSPAPGAAQRRN